MLIVDTKAYSKNEMQNRYLTITNHGDHYEESVSIGKSAAVIILNAISELLAEARKSSTINLVY